MDTTPINYGKTRIQELNEAQQDFGRVTLTSINQQRKSTEVRIKEVKNFPFAGYGSIAGNIVTKVIPEFWVNNHRFNLVFREVY